MKNKAIKILLGICLIAAIAVGVFFAIGGMHFDGFGTQKMEGGDVDAYARQVVAFCKDEPYRPTCYETEVPKLSTTLSSQEVFDVIRLIKQYDSEYVFCHVLAHQLGEYQVSLDPNNWLDVIARAPADGLCSNGFTHGAVLARFNDEILTPKEFEYALKDFSIACEARTGWNPTDLMKAICYHGLGHVLVHITEADMNASLDACEVISLKDDGRDYRKVCTEGVYMQLFQPLEPEDYALIDQLPVAPTRENIKDFCTSNSNTDDQFGTCWREAWPMFYDELFTVDGVMNYCSVLSESQNKNDCFITAFTINGRHHLGQPDKMAQLCNAVPDEYQGMCFARGANAFPEEDANLISGAIDMCSRATSKTAGDECYGFLANTAAFNFHPDSDSFEEMCASLPSKWENRCRKNQ